jgi:hypothetical protein
MTWATCSADRASSEGGHRRGQVDPCRADRGHDSGAVPSGGRTGRGGWQRWGWLQNWCALEGTSTADGIQLEATCAASTPAVAGGRRRPGRTPDEVVNRLVASGEISQQWKARYNPDVLVSGSPRRVYLRSTASIGCRPLSGMPELVLAGTRCQLRLRQGKINNIPPLGIRYSYGPTRHRRT